MAGLALRQVDSKSCAAAFLARHRNGTLMIADHRLHDGEPKPCPLQLRCVIRREQPRAFFRRKTLSRVSYFDAHVAILYRSSQGQPPAGWHGFPGIPDQVLERAMEPV